MIAIFPEVALSAAAGAIEPLAVLFRKYFGGEHASAIRLPVQHLVVQAGLSLKRLPLECEAALLAKDEKGTFSIVLVVNERLAAPAFNFMLAHMLGHYALDILPLIARGDWRSSGLKELVDPLHRYAFGGDCQQGPDWVREDRADAFAAALLLPPGMLKKALAKLEDEQKVAQFFAVSPALLRRRMQDLGLLPSSPVNFIDAEEHVPGAPFPLPQVPAFGLGSVRPELQTPSPAAFSLSGEEPKMPRSFAASSYGAAAKSPTSGEGSRAAEGEGKRGPQMDRQTSQSHQTGQGGMERLRQIAKSLDKRP